MTQSGHSNFAASDTTILRLICGIRFPPACCASSALNYISGLQLGNVSLPSRIRIPILDCVYFYFSNKTATARGCVTLLAALRGLDAPTSILTEKFWVLRLGTTAIYVGFMFDPKRLWRSQLNQLEINPE
jgi:hypothetical protein